MVFHRYYVGALGLALSAAALFFTMGGSDPVQAQQVGGAFVCNGALQASPYCSSDDDDGGDNGGDTIVDTFGAYVVTPNYSDTFWAVGYNSQDSARSAALEVCGKATGKTCEGLGTFWNQCAVYAEDVGGNDVFIGVGKTPSKASKMAMRSCKAKGQGGECGLRTLPVCAGIQYSGAANRRSARATRADVEAESAKYR